MREGGKKKYIERARSGGRNRESMCMFGGEIKRKIRRDGGNGGEGERQGYSNIVGG